MFIVQLVPRLLKVLNPAETEEPQKFTKNSIVATTESSPEPKRLPHGKGKKKIIETQVSHPTQAVNRELVEKNEREICQISFHTNISGSGF